MYEALPIHGTYDYRLVTLSIMIAVCSAYAALDLAGQLYAARGTRRLAWLAGGSFAMGSGIWGMHYVGMQAFLLPVPVLYDWPTVLLSIAAAILASAAALFAVSNQRRSLTGTAAASLVMGLGIAAMHYTGMEAMRLPAMHSYSPFLFILSIVVAIGISYIALELAFSSREDLAHVSRGKLLSALVMGLAICSMHYVGMAAVSFRSMPLPATRMAHAVSISSLSLASICATVVILLLTVSVTSAVSRQSNRYSTELAENRTHIQTIFNSLKEAVVVIDLGQNIVQINTAACDLLGLPEEPTARDKLRSLFEVFLPTGELVPPEALPSALALRGEFLESCELKIRRRDTGKIAYVDISTAPVRNSAGEVVEFILSYRDITQPKEIDEARMRLAAIVESSEDAIIGKDLDGIVQSWNSGAEKTFGYTAAEMVGQSVKRLLPDDRLLEEDNILSRIRCGEVVNHIETIRKKKSGQFINVSLMISPIRDGSGKIVGASKIARNITDRKNLENQLFQSQKMEAIGQLTGGIAHDFNNLLGVIIGNLDLLERQMKDDDKAIKRLNTARNASLRGADLTRRLLAFSSKEQLHPESTSLETVINTVLSLASPALGPEIKITTQLEATLAPVYADAPGLEAALLNLIVNARDSMPQGGKLTITTEVRELDHSTLRPDAADLPPGPYACVSVSDTGHGMAKDVAERAFEPFFTTKPRGKGTGLGLAMVYGFFKQSGGTVRIYSEPGYGTTVSFYLPFHVGVTEHSPAPLAAVYFADKPAHILIVDDEPDLVEVASTSLSELGYIVLTARNGATALAVLAAHPEVELLLSDIIMPGGMNGVDLAQSARKLYPKLKVVYCSGFPADALAEKLKPLAEGPLLRKPYQRAELISIVRQVLHPSVERSSPPQTGEDRKSPSL